MTPKARIWRTLEDLWRGDSRYWIGLFVVAVAATFIIVSADAIYAWLAG